MDLINISNHPSDSEVKRKGKRANIITDEYVSNELKYIDLRVLVKHYKEVDGVEEPYTLIPDYVFRLRADNTTLVDPSTGNYVNASFPNAIGEADYFINIIAANLVSIDSLSEQMIQRADSLNRFNNYDIAQIVTWM